MTGSVTFNFDTSSVTGLYYLSGGNITDPQLTSGIYSLSTGDFYAPLTVFSIVSGAIRRGISRTMVVIRCGDFNIPPSAPISICAASILLMHSGDWTTFWLKTYYLAHVGGRSPNGGCDVRNLSSCKKEISHTLKYYIKTREGGSRARV